MHFGQIRLIKPVGFNRLSIVLISIILITSYSISIMNNPGLVTTFTYCCHVVDLTACIVNILFICKSLWIKAFAK